MSHCETVEAMGCKSLATLKIDTLKPRVILQSPMRNQLAPCQILTENRFPSDLG